MDSLNHIRIRTANLSDIKEISKVFAHSWKSAYQGIVDGSYLDELSNERWIALLTEGFKNRTLVCLVAVDDQRIVGASIYKESDIRPYRKDGELISLYLLPEYVEQGIGHILYQKTEHYMIDQGYKYCILNVLSQNSRAIHFYYNHGFVDTNVLAEVIVGKQKLDCKILRKHLINTAY